MALSLTLLPTSFCRPQVSPSPRLMVTIQIFNKDKDAQSKRWGPMTAVRESGATERSPRQRLLPACTIELYYPLKELPGSATLPPPTIVSRIKKSSRTHPVPCWILTDTTTQHPSASQKTHCHCIGHYPDKALGGREHQEGLI